MAKKRTALAAALNKKKNKTKAVQKKQKTQQKPKETSRVASAKKAIEKGQQRSALGTKVEKKTEVAKVKTENGKTKKVKYSYTPMTMQEYGKMEVGARTGQLQKTLQTDKKLNKKVTDLNVKDYAKSPGVMGALDQMTQGLSVSEDPTYKYSKSQKEIIDSQKKSGKYNVGRAVGAVAEFGLGGTGTVGSSIAKTGGKAVLKEAAEQGGKKLAKQTAKNIAKETAGDTVASAGLNALDAVKFSYEDGKLNKEKFAKELALNVGGDILMGGAVSGITHGLSAKQVANFNRINKSLQKGEKVSDAEMKFYNKHVKELGNKVEAKVKTETQTETQNIPRNSNQEIKTQEPTISKTETVEPTVAKSATTEKTVDPTPLSNRNIEDVGKRTQKAYMYENPEVKPYFQDEARVLLNDLQNNYIKGEKGFSNTLYDTTGDGFFGTTRNIDDDVAELKDKYNWSYEDIEKGLKNIIEDNGKENNAVSKRLEFLIDERLRNGYDDFQYGERISGNDEYMALLRDKEISTYDDEAFNQWARSLDDGGMHNDVDPDWEAVAKNSAENPGKVYKNSDERIRQEHMTAEEFDNRTKTADRTSEVSDAYKNIRDAYFTTDDLKAMAAQNEADGMFNKVKGMSQAEARELAETELSRKGIDRMAEDFVNNDLPTDGHITAARAEVILREMTDAFEKGAINTDLYYQVIEKAAIEFASTAGRNLNAVKMMYKATPEGRIRIIQKQADQLSNEYSSRLNGKKLELSDEQKQMIRNAKTEEEVSEVMKKINLQLWDKIPSSIMEKFNMVRRINMLFNIKTNARNLGGNMALRGARSISDQIEYILTSKAFAKSLEKRGADSVMSTNVTRSELDNAKDYIYKEVFAKNYKNSGSKNRYVEMRRPDGSTVLTSRVGRNLEKATFKVLEAGDVYPAFRPAYTKSYLRWCKHNKIDINDLDALKNMTEKDKALANAYALKQAEIASFRDASKVANALTRLKNKTESGTGKTVAGTAGLRLGNMALEAVLPFVKTPINVFRRSIDYSPISLLRATSDLATYAVRKDTDALLNGIHHLSTGLTGSGVTLLGMWLASQGIVMVKAGEKSGDAFYDRDMGYQDYSLIIGDKSITIDWASPLQTSFFMGAQARNIFDSKDDDRNGMDYFNAALTLFEPHLDASFMSSAKDTLEMFAETAIGDSTGQNNWGEAILTTLGGTIPQNYMNTFLSSQILNQSAQAFDKYQRDTRSTKENPLAKSWESWGRKVANRFPVLRNELLNPKINRRGENVKTQGDNILTRMFHAFINPSNVKTITFDKLDKEIIDIYKNMEEGRDKNYFFYNFTGNPNYDLGNGKRMSYDEAYKYGKESRQQQTNMLKSMINSPRYKKMTSDMKADEVKDTYDIGNVYADRKTYGNKFAADRIAEFSQTDGEARSKLKKMGGNDKDFVGFYLEKEKIVAQTHDTSYQTKAIAAVKYGNDLVSKAYGIWGDKLKTAKKYFKSGGSVKEYTNAMCDVVSKIKIAGVSSKMPNKAVAAAYLDINERTYTAMGISEQRANMGVGLKKYGYSFEALETMEAEALIGYDSDGNNSLKKAEIIEYIDSLGIDSNEKKACIFAYFSEAENPYGNVPNYLGFSSTSSSGGSGGYRRGGGSSKKSSVPSWEDYVKDYITSAEKSSGVNFKDWDSPIDKTYQNKTKAIRKKMEV